MRLPNILQEEFNGLAAVGAVLVGTPWAVDQIADRWHEKDVATELAENLEVAAQEKVDFFKDLYTSLNNPLSDYELTVLMPEGVSRIPAKTIEDEELNYDFNQTYEGLKLEPMVIEIVQSVQDGEPITVTNDAIIEAKQIAGVEVERARDQVPDRDTMDSVVDMLPLIPLFVVAGLAGVIAGRAPRIYEETSQRIKNYRTFRKMRKEVIETAEELTGESLN